MSVRRRRAKGLLPGNPKQWSNERNGLRVRDELAIELTERLPVGVAYSTLLPAVELRGHGDIPCAQVVVESFRSELKSTWSAFALSVGDGQIVVVYNDSHSDRRRRATLMEEFFHLRLGHRPSLIRLYGEDGNRTFDRGVESEAYGSGAAALVPYAGLRQMIDQGLTTGKIATLFGVSIDLVVFRAKVTRLYRRLTHNSE